MNMDSRLDQHKLPMRRPLISLAVAFACGILLKDLSGWSLSLGLVIAGVSSLAAGSLALFKVGGPLRFFLWLTAFLAVGFSRGNLPDVPELPKFESKTVILAEALTGWEVLPNKRRLELRLHSFRQPGGQPIASRARVRLTVYEHWSEDGPRCPEILPGVMVRALAKLRLPNSSHNPGVTDYGLMLRRRGIDWTASVGSCEDILIEVRPDSSSLAGWIASARASLQKFIQARDDRGSSKSILVALTTGHKGQIPTATRESFQRAGLAHLLAISGLHLGFVAFGLFVLLRLLFVRIKRLALRFDVRRLAAATVIPVTIFYMLLSGAHLPAVRACVMVVCFLIAVLVRRESDPLQTLAAAVLIILGIWPQSLFEVSFGLSFSAVTFVIIGLPVLSSWLNMPLNRKGLDDPAYRRILVRTVHFLLMSLTAMLGTAPLVAYYFNQASPMGLLANLVAVPLAAWLIVPLGLLAALVFPLSAGLAGLIADLALGLTGWLVDLAGWLGGISWAAFFLATPSVIQVILSYATLFMLLKMKLRWARWAAFCGLGLLVVLWVFGRLAPLFSDKLEVTFLDVGQGDSALVRLPGSDTILIDGGEAQPGGFDVGRQIVARFLWGQGITRLDTVVVTHPQSDHAGGLPSIVRIFRPRELWTAQALEDKPATASLAQAAREVGTHVRQLRAGQRMLESEGLVIDVVWPTKAAENLPDNERSLVLRISYVQHSFLLTGDLEKDGEAGLLAQAVELEAAVLKLGHHGSRNATSKELLDRVKPGFAVASAGLDNSYGFPHPELLARLAAAGVRVLRTDLHGAISFETDGKTLEISKAK
jgi:competence protein ComEC